MKIVKGEKIADEINDLISEAVDTDHSSDWNKLGKKIDELKDKLLVNKAELKKSFDVMCDDCPYLLTCDENCKAYNKLEKILGVSK